MAMLMTASTQVAMQQDHRQQDVEPIHKTVAGQYQCNHNILEQVSLQSGYFTTAALHQHGDGVLIIGKQKKYSKIMCIVSL
jgi:hypothetical protein